MIVSPAFIIAELLLTSIDAEFLAKNPKTKGFRFYDDYELVCQDEPTAQRLLFDLENAVSQYELTLNRRKTKITKLPDLIEQPWVTELRMFQLPVFAHEMNEKIIDFANIIFLFQKNIRMTQY